MKNDNIGTSLATEVMLNDEDYEIIEARHIAVGSQSDLKGESTDEHMESKALDNLKELDNFDTIQVSPTSIKQL